MSEVIRWDTPLVEINRHEIDLSYMMFDSELLLRLTTPGRDLELETKIQFKDVLGIRIHRAEGVGTSEAMQASREASTCRVENSDWARTNTEELDFTLAKLFHFVVCTKNLAIEVLCGSEPKIDAH